MSGTDLDRDRWLREELHHDRRTSWTAAELMCVEFPEPRWAVPGILAEGLNLLCGPPKLGKSWFALNVAVAVSMGTKAFGRVHVDVGDVLYLALEDPGRRLQSRLRMVLGPEPAPERLTLETACPAIGDGGAALIERWLGEHPDARLVIVDVFTRVRGHVNDRASRYDTDYEAMAAIKTIADQWGISILVVHHTRKQSADDYLDTVSGTHGLAGAADAVLVLARSRGSAEAKLKITGRDVEETEYALNFAADIGTWQLLEGPASDYELTEQRRQIVTLLRDQEGLGPKQIAEATGLSHDVVKHLVLKMADDGTLDTDGSGRYFTPHSLRSLRSLDGGEQGEQGERGEGSP